MASALVVVGAAAAAVLAALVFLLPCVGLGGRSGGGGRLNPER